MVINVYLKEEKSHGNKDLQKKNLHDKDEQKVTSEWMLFKTTCIYFKNGISL